jgi:hypothetical protein
MFICFDLRLVSNVTVELSYVFDCEDLKMLLDGVVGMSIVLDVNSSGVGYVE